MRGRKPKPTEIKKRAGNPGKRRLPRAEPKPRMSADVKADAIGKLAVRFRERYLPELRRLKVLTDVDVAAFELMSAHYATAWNAARRIEREGLTLVVDGATHKHPLLQVFRDNSNAFRAYAAEFGMTPSARTRLHVEEAEQLSLAEMLFGEAARVGDEGAGQDAKE